jgi:hypothetical protein
MRVSAFSVRSNANGRMRVSASVSKTVRSIDALIASQFLDFVIASIIIFSTL